MGKKAIDTSIIITGYIAFAVFRFLSLILDSYTVTSNLLHIKLEAITALHSSDLSKSSSILLEHRASNKANVTVMAL